MAVAFQFAIGLWLTVAITAIVFSVFGFWLRGKVMWRGK